MATVITHVFNEELLLPFWLKHHTPLFDYGVIIDYDSTDRTVEIAKELAPSWEVIRSCNRDFGAEACDNEIMAKEKTIAGWKVALCVTEFVLHNDLTGYLQQHEVQHPDSVCIGVQSYGVVDTLEQRLSNPVINKSLVLQRHNGFAAFERKHRYIHKAQTGKYSVGRHVTYLPVTLVQDLSLLWFGYSPMTPEGVARKLQIQEKIPQSDKDSLTGYEHIIDATQLENQYQEALKMTFDLSDIAEVQEMLQRIAGGTNADNS